GGLVGGGPLWAAGRPGGWGEKGGGRRRGGGGGRGARGRRRALDCGVGFARLRRDIGRPRRRLGRSRWSLSGHGRGGGRRRRGGRGARRWWHASRRGGGLGGLGQGLGHRDAAASGPLRQQAPDRIGLREPLERGARNGRRDARGAGRLGRWERTGRGRRRRPDGGGLRRRQGGAEVLAHGRRRQIGRTRKALRTRQAAGHLGRFPPRLRRLHVLQEPTV